MATPELQSALDRLNARINWEKKLRSGAMRVDLAPMLDLCERLGHPERRYRVVHVAGSKGKGSVSRLIGEGLREAGQRVGVYASPHVERIHERIAIDGVWIDDGLLGRCLERVLALRDAAEAEGTPAGGATWFDLVTATALQAFAETQVDWAVVEVGLGGRLDSTNVVRGALCVITSIELEHTDILGPDRRSIAREKAGILKPGSVLALGVAPKRGLPMEQDAYAEIARIAGNLGVYWEVAAPGGPFAARNQALARLGLDLLGARGVQGLSGARLTPAAIARAVLPGRLEKTSKSGVPVVLDGAHVASSVADALEELQQDAALRGLPRVVLALGQDKDAAAILKTLVGTVDRVYCTSVEGSLHRNPEELADQARAAGLSAASAGSPPAALASALADAGDSGWVLVIGSLHLVGALRGLLVAPPGSQSTHD
ncbi:MAG: bifunctional folylpolyglutamate synthase/dihydrofolate synthase [Planctomycetota bacterium]